jgi:hypothetical protein
MKDIPVFAFPIHPDVDLSRDQIWGGMTLRDYFAAKAMQAILADQYANGIYVLDLDNDSEIVASNAAYTMADAMMKAREA